MIMLYNIYSCLPVLYLTEMGEQCFSLSCRRSLVLPLKQVCFCNISMFSFAGEQFMLKG